ncbi:hypothetical protein SAMN05421692_1300 [Chryseobacterium indologenes]|nr:hypothetical protein SAMN05421692_1300 [Chryseobacterium indologenes]SUX49110.1 Uncharacterised protein [Chryseobacterium indologenes]
MKLLLPADLFQMLKTSLNYVKYWLMNLRKRSLK